MDLVEFDAMRAQLQPIIDKVWRHCEGTRSFGRTVTLKVKCADFRQITRSWSFARPIASRDDLEGVGAELLKPLLPVPVRLLGILLSSLVGGDEPAPQMTLAL